MNIPRNQSERDFRLKAAVRGLLWTQGYSTRLDVLLAFPVDPRGKSKTGKGALTDLDVLGLRLDSGFRVHSAVADCKTSSGRVPERIFWLSGVGRFFGSDANLLVRSEPIPEHAAALARSLSITLADENDLNILLNSHINAGDRVSPIEQEEFFSAELLGETLVRLSRLPNSLRSVELYRESQYWMEPPHVRLQRALRAVQELGRSGDNGATCQLVFADFVWLYVFAIWKALETVTMNGPSRLERGLRFYLSGGEAGLQDLQRLQRAFEELAHRAHVDVTLSVLPPYFSDLHELVTRLVRRPAAASLLARRAEWLLIGQMVGTLGPPPWGPSEEDLITNKLLGDIASFVARVGNVKASVLDAYLDLLHGTQQLPLEPAGVTADGRSEGSPMPAGEPLEEHTAPARDEAEA